MAQNRKVGPGPVTAAYGGPRWRPRAASSLDEIGTIWGQFGVRSEVGALKTVLLHRPGEELDVADPDSALLLAPVDVVRAAAQHDALAAAYEREGVTVVRVEPPVRPPPNQLFAADLFFMTPAGAVLARPASAVRAGEERWVARRLAELGVPIVRSVAGGGTFEGADAMWLDEETVLIGRGLRTNAAGALQVAEALRALGIATITTELPRGTMHLMGQLRIVAARTALVWPGRLGADAIAALQHRGYSVHAMPDEAEAVHGHALNMVTLASGRVLMAAGNPITQSWLEALGVACVTVETSELHRAAGSIGCLSGIVQRA